MAEYRDLHRRLLQTFVQHKALSHVELEQKFIEIAAMEDVESEDVASDVHSAVEKINEGLAKHKLHLSIKRRRIVETDGSVWWSLVNTRNDEIAKMMSRHKEWENALFKQVLGAIVESEDGYVTTTDVVHMAQAPPLSKPAREAERLVRELANEHWLTESTRKGYYTAGVRALIELEPVLRELGAEECPHTMVTCIRTTAYKRWVQAGAGAVEKNAGEEGGSDGEDDLGRSMGDGLDKRLRTGEDDSISRRGTSRRRLNRS